MLQFLLLSCAFICNSADLFVSEINHIDKALAIIEEKRRNNIEIQEVIYVKSGIYSPIKLNAYHSNIHFVTENNNNTVISGALPVNSQWTQQNKIWNTKIKLPANYSVSNDAMRFPKQLWINNKRRNKAQTDILHWKTGISNNGLVYNKGDIDQSWNLLAPGVVVYVYAQWTVSLHSVKYHNFNNQTIIFNQPANLPISAFTQASQKRYYIEGIPEMTLSPNSGEWSASFDDMKNPSTINLYYAPFQNEMFPPNNNNIIFIEHPWIYTPLISISGSENVTFTNFVFEHSSFLCPLAPAECDGYNSVFLGTSDIPGAISLTNTKNITFQQSTFQHIGSFAIYMQKAPQTSIMNNNFSDIGAGSIYFNGACDNSIISDNFIFNTSFIFRQAPGIGGGSSSKVIIEHNEISGVISNGINIAGINSGSPDLVINKNHIHHTGLHNEYAISDYGLIYLSFLNTVNGTAQITNNKLHDTISFIYGGNGIYLDYGTTDVFVYGNLVYNVAGNSFMWNYAQGQYKVPMPPIIIQNNIFIQSGPGQSTCSGKWIMPNKTFERGMLWNTAAPSPYIGNGSFINNINYIVQQNGYKWFSGQSNVTWFEHSQFDQNIYYDKNGDHNVYFP
eukprot:236133_1